MGNPYFKFKQFTITQDQCAMKVSTDSCLFGAWVASIVSREKTILDIGAGTGLLSLMIAQHIDAIVHAVEIETDCYEQLAQNINSSPWAESIHAFQNDIKEFDEAIKYDLIISNPPFYENQLRSPNKNTNLARHGDQLSLTELFAQVERLLSEAGRFALLMPYYRKEDAITRATDSGLFATQVVDVKQTSRHDPFRSMICFSKTSEKIDHETTMIRDENGLYSRRFSELLEAYYLHP
jgi:tRNA1Val (adenine37-N6)-methyltransferase